jgi:hypothetical protein
MDPLRPYFMLSFQWITDTKKYSHVTMEWSARRRRRALDQPPPNIAQRAVAQ